ncbi:MAG: type 1 glutamine amidotransferase domain-containing protein [Acidobacteria bacterium]|nr:type 1 glutamine amidotransferase domain-containing protein [Acidobacteriota bacterium]
MPKKILLVVANPAVSTTLGWPVGFWAAEMVHPWHAFTEVGYEVTLASPKGGKVDLDALSDPRDASGYSAHDILSMGFLSTPRLAALLDTTVPIASVTAADFDAIVVAGGQSPMFTFRGDAALARLFLDFHGLGKPAAALCHGTCLLLDLKRDDGTALIAGKTMTGFANVEEDYADHVVGQKVMPFRIEDEARALGANFVRAGAFAPFAIRDGNLVTGQQQNSGAPVARLVIEMLGR